jgi:predicted HAD superfamily phosphohydrolase
MSETQIITVKNEFGKDEKLEVIEVINLDNKQYAIVSPIDSEVAYAYKMMRKGNEIEYKSIGAGKEFNDVLQKYNEEQE